MSDFEERFSRQVRLAEVGLAGQTRLAHSSLVVCQGPEAADRTAAEIEEAYLQRAGVGRTVIESTSAPPFSHAEHFRHEQCRQVATGAWRALDQIKRVLAAEADHGSS